MVKKFTVFLTSLFAAAMLCLGIPFGNSVLNANAEEPTVASETAVAVERAAAAEPVAAAETGIAPETTTVAQIFKNNVAVANYDTLEAAVDAITADHTLGDTVKLVTAAAPTKSISLTTSLTLDLNSQTITFGGNLHLIINAPNAVVTVKDGTVKYAGTSSTIMAVAVGAAKNTVISNLNVESGGNYGIYIYPQYAGTTTIKDCKKFVSKKYGIDDAGQGKTDIVNCTVENMSHPLYFSSSAKKTVSVTSSNINTATYGMYCAGSINLKVENCTVNNAKYGIYFPGYGVLTVKGGTFTNPTGTGMYIDSHCSGVTIDGVIMKDIGNGINDHSMGNTVIRECKISQFTGNGIFLEKSDEALIYHTEIFDEPETATPAAETKAEPWPFGIVQHGAGLITVQNSKIKFKTARSTGISGNGSVPDAGVTIIDTDITAGYGIYHPEQGDLVVDGGSITAKIGGIEMRAGSLTIKNNTVITVPMDVEYTATENTNGTTLTGEAIGISQHTTNKPITVNIESATLSAPMALVQVDLELDKISGDPSPINIAVKDGNYTGTVQTQRVEHFITGGEFATKPETKYLANHSVSFEEESGKYLVVEDVENEKWEASYYVRLYAAIKHIEYTEEINAIIFSSDNYTSQLVAEAKKTAVAKVDELYNAIVSARAAAITEVKAAAAPKEATATEAALEEVTVPTATYAAIDDATSVAEVEELKRDALAEIAKVREQNALNKIKEAAITEINTYAAGAAATATEAEVDAVVVPTATYAAINGAVSEAEVEAFKQNAIAEIDNIRAKNASDKELGDKVDGMGNKVDGMGDRVDEMENYVDGMGNKVDGMGNKVDGMENKIDGVGNKVDEVDNKIDDLSDKLGVTPAGTATAGTNNQESENLIGVYAMLGVSTILIVTILVLVVVLLVKRNGKDDGKKEEAVKPAEEQSAAATEEPVEEPAPAEEAAAVSDEAAIAEEPKEEEEEEESEVEETEEELAEEQDEEHEAHERQADKGVSVNAEGDAAGDAHPHIVRVHKTFETKLKEASDQMLEDYTMIKNELCNYEGVKDRVCKYCESFHLGHKLVAKIKIIGRSVRLYLALNPADYDEKKYHHVDKSEIKSYAHVPMMVKVNGPRSLSRATALIADCLDGVKKNDDFVWVDFGEQIKKQVEQEKQAEKEKQAEAAAQNEEN